MDSPQPAGRIMQVEQHNRNPIIHRPGDNNLRFSVFAEIKKFFLKIFNFYSIIRNSRKQWWLIELHQPTRAMDGKNFLKIFKLKNSGKHCLYIEIFCQKLYIRILAKTAKTNFNWSDSLYCYTYIFKHISSGLKPNIKFYLTYS